MTVSVTPVLGLVTFQNSDTVDLVAHLSVGVSQRTEDLLTGTAVPAGNLAIDFNSASNRTFSISNTGAGSIGLISADTTFNLLNVTTTTVNAFGAATTIALGAATSVTTLTGQNLVLTGANSTSNTVLNVTNTSNAAAASHAYADISVGGTTSTGDPHLRLTIPGGTSWYVGVDNSASDSLIIGTGTAVGTNGWLKIAAAGTFGVNVTPVAGTLVTIGDLTTAAPLTGTTQNGLAVLPRFTSGATTAGRAGYFAVVSEAAAYTMTTAQGVYVDNATANAGSAITTAYGIYVAAQTGAGTNIGIFSGSPIRVGTDSSNNGIMNASTGAGTATLYIGNASINTTSDVRLKKDIKDTTLTALDLFRKLRVVDYAWNDPSDKAEVNRNSRGRWTGLIAQEAVEHLPFLVNAPDPTCKVCLAGEECKVHDSYWHADWSHEFGIVVKAFQELYNRLDAAGI